MPRCEGLPSGRCPQSVNNRTVKLSQGDLMLCPSCEVARFPYVNASATTKSASSKRATNKRKTATDSKGEVVTAKCMQTDAVSKNNQSDDEEDCTNCDEAVSDISSSIRCDICKNMYHQACSLLVILRRYSPSCLASSAKQAGCAGSAESRLTV